MKRWCFATASAKFVSKMEDVLDIYQRPYDPKRPVICFDETRKELHGTPAGTTPAEPGRDRREDYGYSRNGTASLLLWSEPLTGRVGTSVRESHCGTDVAEFLRHLSDEAYPNAETIVLVCDNLATHQPHFLYERFAPEEARRLAQRFEWHFTPEHGSWLNIAECELSVLSRQCLKRRIADFDTLRSEIEAWTSERNAQPVKVNWQFTTADARNKLKRLYPKRED